MRAEIDIDIESIKDRSLFTAILNDIIPDTYKELHGFHKYWGKKPVEILGKIIEEFTNEGSIILDPFLGSGLVSKECLRLNRKFVGIDINPFSIEHTKFINNLPSHKDYIEAIENIKDEVEESINSTYKTISGEVLSHILWENEEVVKIWKKSRNRRVEVDLEDYKAFHAERYVSRNIRDIKLFDNSRINTKKNFSINDLISNRNLRNIDILIDSIKKQKSTVIPSLLLTLTSSIGQMTKMVFAIENRANRTSSKVEVGSWAIGYWRPKKHFEINVFNCFLSKSSKLTKVLKQNLKQEVNPFSSNIESIKTNKLVLVNDDCLNSLKKIESNSVDLIITDPPHGNRIPYLELSELWNAVLGSKVSYENEIVISEAKNRSKKLKDFNQRMSVFIEESIRIIKSSGYLVLMYNSVHKNQWEFIDLIEKQSCLSLEHKVPLSYSAQSIVQSNRDGSLKSDVCLIYKKIEC